MVGSEPNGLDAFLDAEERLPFDERLPRTHALLDVREVVLPFVDTTEVAAFPSPFEAFTNAFDFGFDVHIYTFCFGTSEPASSDGMASVVGSCGSDVVIFST